MLLKGDKNNKHAIAQNVLNSLSYYYTNNNGNKLDLVAAGDDGCGSVDNGTVRCAQLQSNCQQHTPSFPVLLQAKCTSCRLINSFKAVIFSFSKNQQTKKNTSQHKRQFCSSIVFC